MADISVIKMPNNQSYNLKDAAARESIAALPTDVQINGTSIVTNSVANIPIAGTNVYGVIRIGDNYTGLQLDSGGYLKTAPASSTYIKLASDSNTSCIYRPITPYKQHESVFYGLATAAGDTSQASSDNAVGTYTSTAKAAIQTMLGAQAAIEVIRL